MPRLSGFNFQRGEPLPVPVSGRDQRGERVTAEEVAASKGMALVHFYPFRQGMGASDSFRRLLAELPRFERLGVALLGVQGPQLDHPRARLSEIAIPLVEDPNYKMGTGNLVFPERAALDASPVSALVLLDHDGRVVDAWRDDGSGSAVEEVLAFVRTQRTP